MDGSDKSCTALWAELARAMELGRPLENVRRTALDREVKNAPMWVFVDLHESHDEGKPWVVIAPADKVPRGTNV